MKSYHNIAALIISGLLLTACANESQTETPATSPEVEQRQEGEIRVSNQELDGENLQLVKLSQQDFPRLIRTTGYMDVPPANRASINAQMGGFVKQFSLMEGQEVSQGSLLLTLENTEFVELQQSYLEVVEQLKYLESDYQRQQTMFEENISSRKSFLKAESDYRTAVARANGLREKLRMLNLSPEAVEEGRIRSEVPVYSPIDGKVSQVYVTRGSYVSPTQPIAEIINSEELLLELRLFERDILNLREGQEVRFTTPEISQDFFTAQVSLVGRSINPESRTVLVHAKLPDSLSDRFAAGMFVDAEITGESQQLASLPEEAIQGTGDNTSVLAVKSRGENNTVLERIPVDRGEMIDGSVEIKNAQVLKDRDILIGEINPI